MVRTGVAQSEAGYPEKFEYNEVALLLERVLADTLIPASVLPQPSEAERQGPKASGAPVNLTLEGFAPPPEA